MAGSPSVPDLLDTARKVKGAQDKVTDAMRAVSAELAAPPPTPPGGGSPA